LGGGLQARRGEVVAAARQGGGGGGGGGVVGWVGGRERCVRGVVWRERAAVCGWAGGYGACAVGSGGGGAGAWGVMRGWRLGLAVGHLRSRSKQAQDARTRNRVADSQLNMIFHQ